MHINVKFKIEFSQKISELMFTTTTFVSVTGLWPDAISKEELQRRRKFHRGKVAEVLFTHQKRATTLLLTMSRSAI